MHTPETPDIDPDVQAHLARSAAFDAQHAWPPAEHASDTRPRFVLRPWSIDREAALGALIPPALGSSALDTALAALWLAAHDEDAIVLLRVQPAALQWRQISAWAREHVRPAERSDLLKLVNDMLRAADETQTLPAHERGAAPGNAPCP